MLSMQFYYRGQHELHQQIPRCAPWTALDNGTVRAAMDARRQTASEMHSGADSCSKSKAKILTSLITNDNYNFN
jgi:hypothetical protein